MALTWRRRDLALLCLAVLSARASERVASAQVQRELPAFTSGVELITVDAVVLDAQGRPMPGLTRDAFVVSEDGRPREIVSFEAFAGEPAPAAAEATFPVASNEAAVRASGRAFAILLDDIGIAPERTEAARGAVRSFLERSVRDGDEVMLGTTSGDVWWSARTPEGREDLLAVLSRVKGRYVDPPANDRMTAYEAFRIVNYEGSPAATQVGAGSLVELPARAGNQGSDAPVPGFSVRQRVITRWQNALLCTPNNCDQMVRGRAADLDAQRKSRTRLTLGTARRQLAALALVHGRKSLLLLSDGFVDDRGPELREVAVAAREANTAVYFIDVRGLQAITGFGSAADPGRLPDPSEMRAMALEDSRLAAAGSEELADETGGFSVRNTNDLGAGVERIADESRVFYLLGFYPPEGKSLREWRKLRVEVKRPGLLVRARRGYTLRAAAPPPQPARKGKKGKEAEFSPALARALDSPHDAPGIPLRAMAYVFEPRPKDTRQVLVAVELDASRLAFQPKEKVRVARLELSVVATSRDSGSGFRYDDFTDIVVEGDAPAGWRALAREFELPRGVSQVRVVVRDVTSGAVGSVSQRFEVLPPDVLQLSTPILTDRVEPAKDGQAHPRPALAVHRLFRPDGGLYVQFEVLGAAKPVDGGVPRAAAGFEIWTHDGRLLRKAEPTPLVADEEGHLVRLVGVSLEGMVEGAYDLVLEVEDRVSGARLKQREPFRLGREVAQGSR